jgi:ABC-type antimicrobial peptide transport system ATPase subunit
MRSKPLTVGRKSFATQKAANLYIQELLNSQPLKMPIPEPHHSFLAALISRHPNAAEKIGAGIRHFTVEFAVHGTRCFYLTREDGTRTDFSYLKCVRGSE